MRPILHCLLLLMTAAVLRAEPPEYYEVKAEVLPDTLGSMGLTNLYIREKQQPGGGLLAAYNKGMFYAHVYLYEVSPKPQRNGLNQTAAHQVRVSKRLYEGLLYRNEFRTLDLRLNPNPVDLGPVDAYWVTADFHTLKATSFPYSKLYVDEPYHEQFLLTSLDGQILLATFTYPQGTEREADPMFDLMKRQMAQTVRKMIDQDKDKATSPGASRELADNNSR